MTHQHNRNIIVNSNFFLLTRTSTTKKVSKNIEKEFFLPFESLCYFVKRLDSIPALFSFSGRNGKHTFFIHRPLNTKIWAMPTGQNRDSPLDLLSLNVLLFDLKTHAPIWPTAGNTKTWLLKKIELDMGILFSQLFILHLQRIHDKKVKSTIGATWVTLVYFIIKSPIICYVHFPS